MLVKGRTELDCCWFRSSAEGDTVTGCTKIARFWVLSVAEFRGTSTSDSVLAQEVL